MTVPFVHSRFPRKPDDDYRTLDPRCVEALLASWDFRGPIWEPCAPNGSGIAEAWPWPAHCSGDALRAAPPAGVRYAVTNPPYKTALCVAIVGRLVQLVADGSLDAAAVLLRSQWDHRSTAGSELIGVPPHACMIRLRFRPWWSEKRDSNPIHAFQWAVFDRRHAGEPVTRYWPK